MSQPHIEELSLCIEEALREGAFAAAQSAVIVDGELVHVSAHGGDENGRVSAASIFDVASLTKMVCTTTVTAILVAQGKLELHAPVARYLPAFAANEKGEVTVRDLLAHTSGLSAWEPLFLEAMQHPTAGPVWPANDCMMAGTRRAAFAASRALILERVMGAPLARPRGERVYSDLGFIVLGHLCEVVASKPLDALFVDLVARPLGLDGTRFHGLGEFRSSFADRHIVVTGTTRPREPAPGQTYSVPRQPPRAYPGDVDDDNAYALGGVAGHAGLFSTATDMARYGSALIEEIGGATRLGAGETLAQFAKEDTESTGPKRALGFDMPSGDSSSAGTFMGRGPRGAVGHLGFTGCSLWVDLELCLSVALLSNRVFPSRRNVDGINLLRPKFHDLVCRMTSG